MTIDEIKRQAETLGYNVTKKPCFQCSCYEDYPNERKKHKSGWKCIDKYRPIEYKCRSRYSPKTHCIKISENTKQIGAENDEK